MSRNNECEICSVVLIHPLQLQGFQIGDYLWMSTFGEFKLILMTGRSEAITVKRPFV